MAEADAEPNERSNATSTNPPAGALRELPSRFSPPLVGDTLTFLKDPVGFFAQRTRELGPVFKTKILGDDVVCFVGPEAFTTFLDETYFSRASASPPHVQELLDPDAVPFLDGERFKTRKALLMQIFAERALDSYVRTIERVIGRYARRWAEIGALSWVPELTSMSMTVAGALFLGADPEKDDAATEEAFQTAFGGMLAVPLKLPFTKFGRALRARDYLRGVIADAVSEHVKKEHDDAMSRALAARTKDGEKLSEKEVAIETFHFFGAYVPVIGGLSFLAMLLGQHPDVKEKARAEIREKLGDDPINVASVRKLTYLDHVCRETRRVMPIIPMTFFAKVKEETSFKGYRIPRGAKAVGVISSTLMDPKTFPEPTKFDPDRWAGARGGARQHAAWVPHGGGAHLIAHRCAGEQLADLMLKTFAILTLRDYDWSLPPQDFAPTTGQLFATPRGGLDVRFKRLLARS
jgi:cytochrome P450